MPHAPKSVEVSRSPTEPIAPPPKKPSREKPKEEEPSREPLSLEDEARAEDCRIWLRDKWKKFSQLQQGQILREAGLKSADELASATFAQLSAAVQKAEGILGA